MTSSSVNRFPPGVVRIPHCPNQEHRHLTTSKHHDLDGYQNFLISLLINAMGGAAVASYTSMRFETVEDVVVCLVDVKPSKTEVYADTIKGKNTFYVRVGHTSHIFEGPELVAYVAERFGT